MSGHFLIVEARFYDALADAQVEGATRAFTAAGATYERISVPGALEIPAAIAFAHSGSVHYDGYVALGCVIRGETTHYDIVCNESARALMDLAVAENLAIGNGILAGLVAITAGADCIRGDYTLAVGAGGAVAYMLGSGM